MAEQLVETEGYRLDLKTLLTKHGLEKLLPQLCENSLSVDILRNATESNLREICKLFEMDILTELQFITAIKSIPNSAANSPKDFVFLGDDEKALLDELDDKHKKLSHDIYEIQNAINSLEKSAVICNKDVHEKCNEIISVVEKYRKSLLDEMNSMKSKSKTKLELQLSKYKQLSKNISKTVTDCRQIAINNNSKSARMEQMGKVIDEYDNEEFKLNVPKMTTLDMRLEINYDINAIRSGLNTGLNAKFADEKVDMQFEPAVIDEFDPQCICEKMQYDVENQTVVQLQDEYHASAYLTRIVESGIHHWTFKICQITHSGNGVMLLGIWKVQQGTKPPLNTYFTKGVDQGYAFSAEKGYLTNTTDGRGKTELVYGKICEAGTIVEMILDFNKLSLSYVINDKNYGKAYDIKQAKYRAAIFTYKRNDSIKLLQYKQS